MAINHGASAYATGCRCDVCRAAHTVRLRERRRKRAEQVRLRGLPEGVEHGASAYNNWECRCDICSNAGHEKMVEYYKKTRTSTQPYTPKVISPAALIEKVEKTPSLSEWRAGL